MIRVLDLRRETTPQGQKITFLTRDVREVDEVIVKYKNTPLTVDFKPVRRARSLNANRYHYTLCDKIAKALRTTAEEVHTQLMIDWGTPFETRGEAQMILGDSTVKSGNGIYLRPTGQYEDISGKRCQWFIIIKPSHLYDTAEMSRLIDGTIEEARGLGIETATPDEIARLKAAWRPA